MDDTPIIIDCDTGRDDALAIWSAQSGKVNQELCGVVTSYGNTTLDNATRNTVRALALAGRNDIPVIKGAAQPVKPDHKGHRELTIPRQERSGNGICDIELPESTRPIQEDNTPSELADIIRKLADKHGALDYYITGPATNFSVICDELGDDIYNIINRVIIAGGKMDKSWDEMPGADFNMASDPFAIANILKTKLPVTFVPMDTTWHINMHIDIIKLLAPQTAISEKAKEIMLAYCEKFCNDRVFRFHDPVALFESGYKDSHKTRKLGIITDEDDVNFARLSEQAPHTRDVKVFLPSEELYSEILQQILDTLGLIQA